MGRIGGKRAFEDSGKDNGDEWEIDLDTHAMRVGWTAENDKATLFSAMTRPRLRNDRAGQQPGEANGITGASTLPTSPGPSSCKSARTSRETGRGCKGRSWRNSLRSPWSDLTTSSSSAREAGSGIGPHSLAIGRNLSISLVRIKGMMTFREAAEGFAAHRIRALGFMTT
jgi:hypothetical protein